MSNPILNHAFTTREKGLIITLAVVALFALYFFGVVQNVASSTESNSQKLLDLDEQIATQQTIAQSRESMESEIQELGDVSKLPEVAPYDNIRKEFNMLNGIFKDSEEYTLVFANPELSGTTVRRVATVSFNASSYKEAEGLIRKLEKGDYRCQVGDVNMAGQLMADGSVGGVDVTLSVTFYETTDGATTLTGLQSEDPSSSSSSD